MLAHWLVRTSRAALFQTRPALICRAGIFRAGPVYFCRAGFFWPGRLLPDRLAHTGPVVKSRAHPAFGRLSLHFARLWCEPKFTWIVSEVTRRMLPIRWMESLDPSHLISTDALTLPPISFPMSIFPWRLLFVFDQDGALHLRLPPKNCDEQMAPRTARPDPRC